MLLFDYYFMIKHGVVLGIRSFTEINYINEV